MTESRESRRRDRHSNDLDLGKEQRSFACTFELLGAIAGWPTDMRATTRLLAAFLIRWIDLRSGELNVSIDTISDATQLGRRTVQLTLGELRQRGVLAIVRHGRGGGRYNTVYRFDPFAIPSREPERSRSGAPRAPQDDASSAPHAPLDDTRRASDAPLDDTKSASRAPQREDGGAHGAAHLVREGRRQGRTTCAQSGIQSSQIFKTPRSPPNPTVAPTSDDASPTKERRRRRVFDPATGRFVSQTAPASAPSGPRLRLVDAIGATSTSTRLADERSRSSDRAPAHNGAQTEQSGPRGERPTSAPDVATRPTLARVASGLPPTPTSPPPAPNPPAANVGGRANAPTARSAAPPTREQSEFDRLAYLVLGAMPSPTGRRAWASDLAALARASEVLRRASDAGKLLAVSTIVAAAKGAQVTDPAAWLAELLGLEKPARTIDAADDEFERELRAAFAEDGVTLRDRDLAWVLAMTRHEPRRLSASFDLALQVAGGSVAPPADFVARWNAAHGIAAAPSAEVAPNAPTPKPRLTPPPPTTAGAASRAKGLTTDPLKRVGVDELLRCIRRDGRVHARDVDWMRERTAGEDDQAEAIETLYQRLLKREVAPDAEFVEKWNAAEAQRNEERHASLRKQAAELLRRQQERASVPAP